MDGSSTFLILAVLGLWVYGRALRQGIISGLSTRGAVATSSGAPDTNAVQGATPGASDSIPNSNGFSAPDGSLFYETGPVATPSTSSGKPGVPSHDSSVVRPIYPIFGGYPIFGTFPVDSSGDSGGSTGTSSGTNTGKPGFGVAGPGGFNSPVRAL